MDFLSEIISVKRQRVAANKVRVPLERMRELALHAHLQPRSSSLRVALSRYGGINVIAEFKRRSPSKGRINARADPAVTANSTSRRARPRSRC